MTTNNKLNELMASVIHRYSARFNKLGSDVRTLGWGNKDQQYFRFKQALRIQNFNNKSILDIGCGFGDFYYACMESGINISHYTGWDINPDLIEAAQNKNTKSSFKVIDISTTRDISVIADIGVMLGVLNLNFKDNYNNIDFSKMMIKKAFDSVSESLVVDFLSSKLDLVYPEEDFVFYHDPAAMLTYALTLTPNVRLFHDYAPIPQKEFMLVLEHV